MSRKAARRAARPVKIAWLAQAASLAGMAIALKARWRRWFERKQRRAVAAVEQPGGARNAPPTGPSRRRSGSPTVGKLRQAWSDIQVLVRLTPGLRPGRLPPGLEGHHHPHRRGAGVLRQPHRRDLRPPAAGRFPRRCRGAGLGGQRGPGGDRGVPASGRRRPPPRRCRRPPNPAAESLQSSASRARLISGREPIRPGRSYLPGSVVLPPFVSKRFTRESGCSDSRHWPRAALLLPRPARALDPEKGLSECTVEVWGLRDGLSGTMVRRIAQTPDGYLWIAAFGGIARFDGARILRIEVEPPMDLAGLGAGAQGPAVRRPPPRAGRLRAGRGAGALHAPPHPRTPATSATSASGATGPAPCGRPPTRGRAR